MKQIATKVADSAYETVDDIAWQNRLDKAGLMRMALTAYMEENPDDLEIRPEQIEDWTAEVDDRSEWQDAQTDEQTAAEETA